MTYDQFVHAGADLSPADKERLKKMNEEGSTLSDTFSKKLLAANTAGAYTTNSPEALAGLSEAQLAAAAEAAQGRHVQGYLVPLQNTTQQPVLGSTQDRARRGKRFSTTPGTAPNTAMRTTRAPSCRGLRSFARSARSCWGFRITPPGSSKTRWRRRRKPRSNFLDTLVPWPPARAAREGKDIQAVIDAQHGGFTLEAWDWDFYAEQVRKAKYDLDDAEVKPYFELNNVLENGVFYAANQLYGITFKERKDIPVYQPDVRVFEVIDADGKPLALFYCDYFKRDNKSGGAWMSNFVGQSKLLGTRPVIYNVGNLPKPAPGEPALISFDDVTTMFHEFGHALHGMFAEHRISEPFRHRDGARFRRVSLAIQRALGYYIPRFSSTMRVTIRRAPSCRRSWPRKIKRAENFNKGYDMTELLAAAELDMQWHMLPAECPAAGSGSNSSRRRSTRRTSRMRAVPPRYRSSYFQHIWAGGYSAGYYAYLWTEMLADDAFQWFDENGGLTRANGDRFRQMILSRGNTEDLATLYATWRGRAPKVDAMLKDRGLIEP